MARFRRIALYALGLVIAMVSDRPAFALGGTCPLPWDDYDCQVTQVDPVTMTTYSADICWVDAGVLASGGDLATCSAANFTLNEATINVVAEYIAPGHALPVGSMQAWGYINGTGAGAGQPFCCSMNINDQYPCVLVVQGTLEYGDTLRLKYDPAAGPTKTQLACPNEVHGYGGNDHIIGSLVDAVNWDALFGEEDNDTILGELGADTIDGDDGEDVLNGGAGNDVILGGDDHDVITGGTGEDTIEGGEAVDWISGGPGGDDLDGGTGADEICGGAGPNQLNDGDTDADGDLLWGETAGSHTTCQSTNTAWQNIGGNTGCGTSYLSSEPPNCP